MTRHKRRCTKLGRQAPQKASLPLYGKDQGPQTTGPEYGLLANITHFFADALATGVVKSRYAFARRRLLLGFTDSRL